MGIFDMLFSNHESIGKGFEALTKGTKYIVAYNIDNQVIAYTTGIDVGKQLMDKYIIDNNLNNLRFEEEFHKGKDEFLLTNEDYQICIVDKSVMIKKDVIEMMKTVDLIPDKKNKMMVGLDKYTTK